MPTAQAWLARRSGPLNSQLAWQAITQFFFWGRGHPPCYNADDGNDNDVDGNDNDVDGNDMPIMRIMLIMEKLWLVDFRGQIFVDEIFPSTTPRTAESEERPHQKRD